MNKETYEHWWQLHLKVAEGKELTATEQEEYNSGDEVLNREEEQQLHTGQSVSELIAMKTRIIELQILHSQLELKSTRLDARIAQLEQTYRKITGFELAGELLAGS